MRALLCLIKKELLLLSRDLHGLLLLFIMPAVFILIMTFALQNQYAINTDTPLDYYLINHDDSELSEKFVRQLAEIGTFKRLPDNGDEAALKQLTQADKAKFLVVIAPGFEQQLLDQQTAVQLHFAPGTSPIFAAAIESQASYVLNRLFLEFQFGDMVDPADLADSKALLQSGSLYSDDQQYPSSVQQNVPAWLLFSMFFIAIPLSTTLINERQQGTLVRLRSIGIPMFHILAGKLIPYFFINLLQVVMLFLIGMYLVPLLGGEQLTLGQHPQGLAVLAIAASLAAVCYALLVAQITSTVEQATIFSAVCNIIMAAIGGVMVPRFIMPPAMQELSSISPMAWGLDGFFDILLRGANVAEILPEAGKLLLFAAVMMALALLLSRRRHKL